MRRRAARAGSRRSSVVPGTVPLLCTMIGSTAFDGFSQGPTWSGSGNFKGLGPALADFFGRSGSSRCRRSRSRPASACCAACCSSASSTASASSGCTSVGDEFKAAELRKKFVHTLVPIAVAYVIAHYFSLLVYQGQATAFLAPIRSGTARTSSGPRTRRSTTRGSARPASGTSRWRRSSSATSAGLALAHDRALAIYENPRDATRSQYWMLTVMVGFTCLGLWLLSATN